MKRPSHPMQPIERVNRVWRFKANAIVAHLFDVGAINLNHLKSNHRFDDEEYEQIYQLIGYSVSGIGDIEEVSKELVERADAEVQRLLKAEEYRK